MAEPFGEALGAKASLYTLEAGGLRARITDYAGALVSLEAPDRSGRRDHIVLGFDDVADYIAAGGSFGALLGRNANRIAGGRLAIDGTTYRLSQNENGNTLHGGARGFNKRYWTVAEAGKSQIRLTLDSPDGDQGFPGDVHAEALWRLDEKALSLSLTATTTRPTALSLSAHPYFNLDGPSSAHCLDHEIAIDAGQFLETDAQQIPTGVLLPVADTPFDFRTARPIRQRIREPHAQLRYGKGYDHYFVLAERTDALRQAIFVRAQSTGRTLEILTTQPGVQFYTGNNLNGSVAGRGGLYRQSAGFAIEPQGFPDAPNHPGFPSVILRPGQAYRQEIVYRLGVET
ncbi:MAG TPA: aldose epimerase family protein [Stellaceae bacterium]|nr:aldose epimerase family protein [Stellaceae bacterium]